MNINKKYKRILIIEVNWLGDVLFSTPFIKSVRKKFKDAYFNDMIRQYERARALNSISPVSLFEYVCEAVVGGGIESVPEPNTLALLVVAALAGLLARRRALS